MSVTGHVKIKQCLEKFAYKSREKTKSQIRQVVADQTGFQGTIEIMLGCIEIIRSPQP